VDSTVNAVLSLQPQHVLEIGCGTGLLLSRIAPYCSQYWGTDISPVALQQIEQLKQTDKQLEHVMLFKRKADELSDITPKNFDTIIINSVIQYFPNVTYLLDVLEQTFKLLKSGGYLFIGDIRSLPLLKAYHASVQFYQAPDSLTKLLLQQRVQQQMKQEEELVIDPTFFVALKQQYPQITQVQIQLKPGYHHNEMTRFRYDVVLQLNGPVAHTVEIPWQDWQSHPLTLSTLHQHLVENNPDIFGLRQVPNKRLVRENQLLEWLANAAPTETVGELRQTLSKHQPVGIDSSSVWQLAAELPYDVAISWSDAGIHGNYDVLFKHHDNPLPITDYQLPISNQPLPSGGMSKQTPKSHLNSGVIEYSRKTWPWHDYANNPLQGKQTRTLIPQLRQFLQDQLPEYMVPSAFVMLEAIPLTPNGKINRRALLALETLPGRQKNYVAPSTETEEVLAQIWREVLGLERIGIHDNFFELGGHSLLATQVMSRIQNHFSIELPLRELFESPTVAGLSELLEKQKAPKPPTHTSTERERIVL
jgi:ubiquinone/menaquinone biosynthesis C-methylase UbiE/acyl carrier protein